MRDIGSADRLFLGHMAEKGAASMLALQASFRRIETRMRISTKTIRSDVAKRAVCTQHKVTRRWSCLNCGGRLELEVDVRFGVWV